MHGNWCGSLTAHFYLAVVQVSFMLHIHLCLTDWTREYGEIHVVIFGGSTLGLVFYCQRYNLSPCLKTLLHKPVHVWDESHAALASCFM